MASVKGGDKVLAKLREVSSKLTKVPSLSVGFGNHTYLGGTTVAFVAAMNEYGGRHGSSYQPPRPFFRIFVEKNKSSWSKDFLEVFKATGYEFEVSLNLMGLKLKGQLQDSIIALMNPPLAPSTIARKGFSKPLIEKGIMLDSVEYQLRWK